MVNPYTLRDVLKYVLLVHVHVRLSKGEQVRRERLSSVDIYCTCASVCECACVSVWMHT